VFFTKPPFGAASLLYLGGARERTNEETGCLNERQFVRVASGFQSAVADSCLWPGLRRGVLGLKRCCSEPKAEGAKKNRGESSLHPAGGLATKVGVALKEDRRRILHFQKPSIRRPMKELLLTTILSATCAAAFGQGTIAVGNNFTPAVWQAPIYGTQPGYGGLYGNGTFASPASAVGTTVYFGSPLSGTGWDIAFYAGPTTATSYQGMTLLTLETAFGTKTALPWAMTGGAVVPVPNVPAGGADANYQVFIWSYTAGNQLQYADYASALAAWQFGNIADLGGTPVLTIGGSTGLGGGSILPPNTEFQSFSLQTSPEPGTVSLIGLGAGGMLVFRPRRR
jgi:hypothetical protein